MTRCFAQPESWSDDSVILDAEEAHHLSHVLRGRVGDRVSVLDGTGRTAECEIAERSESRVILRILSETRSSRSGPRVVLIQALVKGQRMDWILQKGVELGVSVILPVETTHCVVRIRPDERENRRARWQKIVLSALKQSGVPWLPEVAPPAPLTESLQQCLATGPVIHCSLREGVRPLKEVLPDLLDAAPRQISLLVGPEGDFSADEEQSISEAGATPVSLGQSVLRSETAAIYVLGALKYELAY